MNRVHQAEQARIKRLIGLYNMTANLLWSALIIVPLFIFCYRYVPLQTLLIFTGISLLVVLLPGRFFDRLLLAKTTATYKKLGVHYLNYLTQNGTLVNKLTRKKYPAYRGVYFSAASIKKLLLQSRVQEKFHYSLFVFFSLLIGTAILKSLWAWSFIMLVGNILYNVYPVFLQQYTRLKLKPAMQRRDINKKQ